MTLTQFPVFYSKNSDFHKHNRRLGKVSREMQKIIEDIQGKREEKSCRSTDPGCSESGKCGCRKRHSDTHLIEKDWTCQEHTQCQSGRMASLRCRKHNENGQEQQEIVDRLVLNDSTETRRKLRSGRRNPSDLVPRLLEAMSKTYGTHSLSMDENYHVNSKRSKVEIGGNICTSPWKRPLPPLPEERAADSQAQIYNNVLETVQNRLKAKQKYCQQMPVTLSPVACLAKITEAREGRNDESIECPVVGEMSSDKESKFLPTSGYNCDEEHIYESIDESDAYESIDNGKVCGLYRASDRSVAPHSDTSQQHTAARERFPRSAIKAFRHEDTYLEPFLSEEEISHCSVYSNLPNTQCSDPVSNVKEYSRKHIDFAARPAKYVVPVPLRATFV